MAQRAADINRSNYGPLHVRAASDIVSLMAVEVARGDLDAAETRLSEVAAIIMAARPDDRTAWLRRTTLHDLLAEAAMAERSAPLVERAITTLQDAFSEDAQLLGVARELVMTALQIRGDTLVRAERAADAAAEYERGLSLALLTTENFLDDAVFQIRLAYVGAKSGDKSVVQAHLSPALENLSRAGHPAPAWYVAAELSKLSGALGHVPLLEETVTTLIDDAIEGDAVPTFRGQLTAAMPPEWLAKESTTLLAPDGLSNIIASSEPVDPSFDSERYAAIQGDLLRTEFPDYEEKQYEAVPVFGGRSGYLRSFEWTPPDGERVAQIQLYYVEEGRGYTATATAPIEAFAERELLLREILRGLQITD
jgi:hypothetical protein